MARRFFTSESVTEGHPDKVCDQISDAILDAIIEKDPEAHVACETFTTTGMVVCMGEINTSSYVPVEKIEAAVDEVFDLRPGAIIDALDLRRPIYRKTAAYGHFGRELPEFTWERTDRVDALKRACE